MDSCDPFPSCISLSCLPSLGTSICTTCHLTFEFALEIWKENVQVISGQPKRLLLLVPGNQRALGCMSVPPSSRTVKHGFLKAEKIYIPIFKIYFLYIFLPVPGIVLTFSWLLSDPIFGLICGKGCGSGSHWEELNFGFSVLQLSRLRCKVLLLPNAWAGCSQTPADDALRISCVFCSESVTRFLG